MEHSKEPKVPNPTGLDEKGKPLDMPPEYMEEGGDEPLYERAQINQNRWHHYAVR